MLEKRVRREIGDERRQLELVLSDAKSWWLLKNASWTFNELARTMALQNEIFVINKNAAVCSRHNPGISRYYRRKRKIKEKKKQKWKEKRIKEKLIVDGNRKR